jgi:hypothetical protein
MFGRRDRDKTLTRDQPIVQALAHWASSPNADQASAAICADTAVEHTVGI